MFEPERERFLDWISQNGEPVEGGLLVSLDGLIDPSAVFEQSNLESAFLHRMRPLPSYTAIWLDPYLGERAAILARKSAPRATNRSLRYFGPQPPGWCSLA